MKTDLQLQHDVMAELAWDPAVHAAQIGVTVRKGIVTLSGEVSSLPEKWLAECAAQRVRGVRAVTTEMKVKLSALGQRNDADIAAAARRILGNHSALAQATVKVLVHEGWLVLTGEVPSQVQRELAAHSLRPLSGVIGISNQIALRPPASARVAKADIENALTRRASVAARTISVQVQGSDVTLTGTVHSWADRQLVTGSAWGATGVRRVVDHLTLVP